MRVKDFVSIDAHIRRDSKRLPRCNYPGFYVDVLPPLEDEKNCVQNRVTKTGFMVSAVVKLSLQTVLEKTPLCLSSMK